MGFLTYTLFLYLYKTGFRLVSPWNKKARLWIKGRRDLFTDLSEKLGRRPASPLVWMHCASLGEFEQGRPVLEAVRQQYPGTCILLTFFSSSGYEVRKDYQGADYVFYLPTDYPDHAKRFIDIVKPSLVLWIKYEFWYNYLHELRNKNIPVLLVSGNFKRHQLFFKWYGGRFYRKMLACFSHIFVQTVESKRLLRVLGFSENVSVSGDTRFDRVVEIAEKFEQVPFIEQFCAGKKVIVAGSTWIEDEEELDHFANANQEIQFIIVPHETDAAHIRETKRLFRRSVVYSLWKEEFEAGRLQGDDVNVLIVDTVGLLSRLYQYATVTYVGGGFGSDGIHNVLEAAVYGKPVVFGPVYDRFVEAGELLDCGGAFSVSNALELEEVLNVLMKSRHEYTKASDAARDYVYSKRGATGRIMHYIAETWRPGG